jgi:hypothetical protein
VRQVAALAGVGIAAAAVALPALAQTEPATQPIADAETTVSTAAPAADPATSAPVSDQAAEQAALDKLNNATPEERMAFVQMFMTPEQRFAFTLYISTPEQREAILAYVNAVGQAASAPQVSGPVRTSTPATQTGRGGSGGNNSFLNCVRNRESHGNYSAYNPSGASGAYQMMPGTAAAVARHAGRPDLAGRPVSSWSPADQDAMARALYAWQGSAPWGGGC